MRPGRAWSLCWIAGAALGCTGGSAAGDGRPQPAAGTLQIDVPAQLAVAIDGRPAQVATAVPVDPGPHTIELDNLCGRVVQEVAVPAGEHVTLGPAAFPTLALARLRVHPTATDGTAPDVGVRLENTASSKSWSAPESETWVPACPLRLTIVSEGRGAFIEDVAFAAGDVHSVAPVLAPGPDVVRIHGGTFVAGPPAPSLGRYRESDPHYQNVERTVATFDLDRTEVTVGQYQACVDAGVCVETPQELVKLTHPLPRFLDECNSAHRALDHRTVARTTTPGKEDHPINCVSAWEAERYCAWAGKRLPTSIEWEFAARSGRTAYAWPWGNDEATCRAHTSGWVDDRELCPSRSGTAVACSYPAGNSEQGVCDLVGNVAELVEFPPGDSRRGGYNNRGASVRVAVEVFHIGAEHLATEDRQRAVQERFVQEVEVGFRCARDVEEAAR